MKNLKRLFALVMMLTLLCTLFVSTSYASGNVALALTSATSTAGEDSTVQLKVSLTENTGFMNMYLNIEYDSTYLTLASKPTNAYTTATPIAFMAGGDITAVPFRVSWTDEMNFVNHTETGDLLTLTFNVSKDAPVGDYDVSVKPVAGWTNDADWNYFDPTAATGKITVESGEPAVPTATSIGLKTDDSQILRLSNIDVNNVDGTSYKVDTALGFVSCVNKDAKATGLYTEINLEGWTGEALKIPANHLNEIGDQIYFVAAVTSIREDNLKTPFTAKAYATVDGQLVADSNTVSAAYDVQ